LVLRGGYYRVLPLEGKNALQPRSKNFGPLFGYKLIYDSFVIKLGAARNCCMAHNQQKRPVLQDRPFRLA
jgi:hypothetical protein